MERMAAEMQAASDDMEFERAARLRDRIRALASIAQEQQINPQTVDEADVFALHAEGGQACVQVFFFRAGQNWGNRAYFPRVDKSDEDADIMGAFLGQFYADKRIPRRILVNVEPSEQALLTEAFALEGARRGEDRSPAARREAPARSARPDQRQRGAGPQDGRELGPVEATFGGERGLRPGWPA